MYNDDNIKTVDEKHVNDKIIDKKIINENIAIKVTNKIINKTIKLIPSLICDGKCNKCEDISNCF